MISRPGDEIVEIAWVANPFRGDAFEEVWRPASEAALDFGATSALLIRSVDNPNKFIQYAAFPDRLSFERYWLSEEIAEARARVNGWHGLPVLPIWHTVVASSETADQTA